MEKMFVGVINNRVLPLLPDWVEPNHLSWSRIWGVPFIWGTYVIPIVGPVLSFLVYSILAITDAIDGALARKKQIFKGKRLDEVADKTHMISTIALLFAGGTIPFAINNALFWAMAVIIFRELLISSLREAMPKKAEEVPSLKLAKLKTFVLMPTIGLFLLAGLEDPMGPIFYYLGVAVLPFGVVLSVVSGGQYVWLFFKR